MRLVGDVLDLAGDRHRAHRGGLGQLVVGQDQALGAIAAHASGIGNGASAWVVIADVQVGDFSSHQQALGDHVLGIEVEQHGPAAFCISRPSKRDGA